ncbi:MAG: UDP-N-acetylmuramyl-tripeptide synthetase [Candidatus Liptonbacteria bacterium]|nr:UDP-N-acetylmuramyl-tripeptide synthetase [Candidatus Liptonbacteria bacterium]
MGFLKKITPGFLLDMYHWGLAYLGAVFYGFPSKKLIIIGVTGTKGKTSTAYFIWRALNSAGMKTGMIGTISICVGDEEKINNLHMTMPGRFIIQKNLHRMLEGGCLAAVIETTSEGIKQWRHKGIVYDIAVFTNLTPEHIPSHGSFENYRAMKQKVFQELSSSFQKTVSHRKIPKIIVANVDSAEAPHFLKFASDQKITFGLSRGADIRAENVIEKDLGVEFKIKNQNIKLALLGKFNALNALPAVIIGEIFKLEQRKIIEGIQGLSKIPGRMEIVQKTPFMVVVDFSYERESMTAALKSGRELLKKGSRLIVLLGAPGGGRDKSHRPIMGQIAAQMADLMVVSTDEPYNDDPLQIINDISEAATEAGKREGINLFRIPDRREGIQRALSLAKPGDVVIISGMGALQVRMIGNKAVPWDDRTVVREELAKIKLG